MRENLEYGIVVAVARCLGAMPRGLARIFSGCIAFGVYWGFGRLRRVGAMANSDNSGNATITIDPPITTVGAYATVDSSPILNAPITVMGSCGVKYKQNLAVSRDAFGLVMVPMELPQGVDFAARQQWKGMSLRIIRQYDINSDVMPCRMDILYGTTTFYPELACRLTN